MKRESEEPAKKARVYDITNGRFVPAGGEQASACVITPLGEKLHRVNVLGTITEKFESENGRYSNVTIDDGTGSVRVKAFGGSTAAFRKFKPGDSIIAVGRASEYQGEVYISLESINLVPENDKNYENLRRLELLDNMMERRKVVENLRLIKGKLNEQDMIEYAKKSGLDEDSLNYVMETKDVDYKPRILEILSKLDHGKGAETLKIFEASGLPESVTERAMDDLLSEGYIFEPAPGRFKVINIQE